MNKKIVIGLTSVLGFSVVYLSGVYYSGQEADKFIAHAVEQAKNQTQGQAFIQVNADTGFYSSHYQMVYTPAELPKGAEEWMGGRDIPFNLEVKHGFLGAASRITLADSGLLAKLKSIQTNTELEPVTLEVNQRFNPLSQTLSMTGSMQSGQFVVVSAKQEKATLGAIQLEFEQKDRDFMLDFAMQDSGVEANNATLSIQGITGHETGHLDHDDPLQAVMVEALDGVFNIERVVVENDKFSAQVEGLNLEIQQRLEAGRLLTDINYAADSFSASQAGKAAQTIEAPNLQLAFDLDYLTTRELAIMLQQVDRSSEAMLQQMEGLMVVADGVTRQGIGMDVNDLSVSWEGHKAQGSAELDLAPFAVSEIMSQPDKIRQYVTLNAQFTVPAAMLEAMPDYNPRQINGLVQMGFVQKKGDEYQVELKVKGGVATLNGQVMPM
ncbi:DUF945 family protein [Neptunomonas antarctica]|uniref:Uncharacterized conserved protein YdgA, DUF945 family n=1 Tax=Neptunomonas antarctica TaxID=619304 RepID=A0A1N7PAW6_9GAMM|nr:DUF945 family protein [Neptunomonas antarctica]SIT07711.1 Uncharacterized conserved protein YdgA, DUF945 family [Neptunomonas antarctica]